MSVRVLVTPASKAAGSRPLLAARTEVPHPAADDYPTFAMGMASFTRSSRAFGFPTVGLKIFP